MEQNTRMTMGDDAQVNCGQEHEVRIFAANTLAAAHLHCTPSRSIPVGGLCSATCYPLAARVPEARCTCPLSFLRAPHRSLARSSHLLAFCALTRVLSDGTARCGAVFGMQLFAIRPRSRSSFAKAMAAQWRRVAACAAG